jgi:hypothetical protein
MRIQRQAWVLLLAVWPGLVAGQDWRTLARGRSTRAKTPSGWTWSTAPAGW